MESCAHNFNACPNLWLINGINQTSSGILGQDLNSNILIDILEYKLQATGPNLHHNFQLLDYLWSCLIINHSLNLGFAYGPYYIVGWNIILYKNTDSIIWIDLVLNKKYSKINCKSASNELNCQFWKTFNHNFSILPN